MLENITVIFGPYGCGKTSRLLPALYKDVRDEKGWKVTVMQGHANIGRRYHHLGRGHLVIIDHAEHLHASVAAFLVRLGGMNAGVRPGVVLIVGDLEIGIGWASVVCPQEDIRVIPWVGGFTGRDDDMRIIHKRGDRVSHRVILAVVEDTLDDVMIDDIMVFVPSIKDANAIEDAIRYRGENVRIIHHSSPPSTLRTRTLYIVTPKGENILHTLPRVSVVIDTGTIYQSTADGNYELVQLPACRTARRAARGRTCILMSNNAVGSPLPDMTRVLCESVPRNHHLSHRARMLFPDVCRDLVDRGFLKDDDYTLTIMGEIVARVQIFPQNARIIGAAIESGYGMRWGMLIAAVLECNAFDEDEGDIIQYVSHNAARLFREKEVFNIYCAMERALQLLHHESLLSHAEEEDSRFRLVLARAFADRKAHHLHGRYYHYHGTALTVLRVNASVKENVIVVLGTRAGTITSYFVVDVPVETVTRFIPCDGIPRIFHRVNIERDNFIQRGYYTDSRQSGKVIRIIAMKDDADEAEAEVREWIASLRQQLLSVIHESADPDTGAVTVMHSGGEVSDLVLFGESVALWVSDGFEKVSRAARGLRVYKSDATVVCATREDKTTLQSRLIRLGVSCATVHQRKSRRTAVDLRLKLSLEADDDEALWPPPVVQDFLRSHERESRTVHPTSVEIHIIHPESAASMIEEWKELGARGIEATICVHPRLDAKDEEICKAVLGTALVPSWEIPCTIEALVEGVTKARQIQESFRPLVVHRPEFCGLGGIPRIPHAHVVHRRGLPTISIYGTDDNKVRALETIEEIATKKTTTISGGATCPVCFDENASVVLATCGHVMCTDCLIQYLHTEMTNPGGPSIRCPVPECRRFLLVKEIEDYAAPDVFQKWKTVKTLQMANRYPMRAPLCPSCHSPPIARPAPGSSNIDCQRCQVIYCMLCSRATGEVVVAHEGRCAVARNKTEIDEGLKNLGVYGCPCCGAPIEKNGGCSHMECTAMGCGAHFCWGCMNEMSPILSSPRAMGTIQEIRVDEVPSRGTVTVIIKVHAETWPKQLLEPRDGLIYLRGSGVPQGAAVGENIEVDTTIESHRVSCAHPVNKS